MGCFPATNNKVYKSNNSNKEETIKKADVVYVSTIYIKY